MRRTIRVVSWLALRIVWAQWFVVVAVRPPSYVVCTCNRAAPIPMRGWGEALSGANGSVDLNQNDVQISNLEATERLEI